MGAMFEVLGIALDLQPNLSGCWFREQKQVAFALVIFLRKWSMNSVSARRSDASRKRLAPTNVPLLPSAPNLGVAVTLGLRAGNGIALIPLRRRTFNSARERHCRPFVSDKGSTCAQLNLERKADESATCMLLKKWYARLLLRRVIKDGLPFRFQRYWLTACSIPLGSLASIWVGIWVGEAWAKRRRGLRCDPEKRRRRRHQDEEVYIQVWPFSRKGHLITHRRVSVNSGRKIRIVPT
jgi:hypothetical protein